MVKKPYHPPERKKKEIKRERIKSLNEQKKWMEHEKGYVHTYVVVRSISIINILQYIVHTTASNIHSVHTHRPQQHMNVRQRLEKES